MVYSDYCRIFVLINITRMRYTFILQDKTEIGCDEYSYTFEQRSSDTSSGKESGYRLWHRKEDGIVGAFIAFIPSTSIFYIKANQ